MQLTSSESDMTGQAPSPPSEANPKIVAMPHSGGASAAQDGSRRGRELDIAQDNGGAGLAKKHNQNHVD